MDWSTVILSAGVSTLISTVVALVAVPRTVALTERAKRRDAARLALQDLVGRWSDQFTRYRTASPDRAARTGSTLATDDLVEVQRALGTCSPLPSWQRALVARRLRRIYGREWLELATEYPTEPTGEGAFIAILAMRTARPSRHAAGSSVAPDYLLHRAYSTAPQDAPGLGMELAREFRKLRRGR